MHIAVCALTVFSDVCVPGVVDQEAGVREVKNMVLLLLHLLAEPYSELHTTIHPNVYSLDEWHDSSAFHFQYARHVTSDLLISKTFILCRSHFLRL